MKQEQKHFALEIKELGSGQFEGWLSVYDVVDLGQDLVLRGAFAKTIKENKGTVPLLWQHDTKQPIGTLELEDKEEGLWVTGTLLVDEGGAPHP